jgi:hypothetical protein
MNLLEELNSSEVLWQMSMAERATVLYLLSRMRQKEIAIEVGTYRGGFLRVLERHFARAYSLDVDHSQVWGRQELGRRGHVEWREGDSRATLPQVLAELRGQPVNLILIDGDHEAAVVAEDIRNVLLFVPVAPLVVLMHDSWYGPTREAINGAPWHLSPYVQSVEKDLVPGELVGGPRGNFFVGGLAMALLDPTPRQGDLKIGQAHDYTYSICLEALAFRDDCVGRR